MNSEIENKIEELKKLKSLFDPYDDEFDLDNWYSKVSKIVGFNMEDLSCGDYFYDGDCLGFYIRGIKEAKKLLEKQRKEFIDKIEEFENKLRYNHFIITEEMLQELKDKIISENKGEENEKRN